MRCEVCGGHGATCTCIYRDTLKGWQADVARLERSRRGEYEVGDACYLQFQNPPYRLYFRIDEITGGAARCTLQNLSRGRVWVKDISGLAPADVTAQAATWEAAL